MRMKGYGWKSWNHWAPYGNSTWSAHNWDPTYPTYPIPGNSWKDPDRTKYQMIARYVQEYNVQMAGLAARLPQQVLLVRTEGLSEPAVQQKIFDFAGMCGRVSEIRLNVRSLINGRSFRY